MKIYFEDGFLVDTIRLPEHIDFKFDAAKGFSYCKSRLETLLDFGLMDKVIYTNSVSAVNSKYVWNYSECVPELYIRDRRHGCFTRLDNLINETFTQQTNLLDILIKYMEI